MPFEFEKQKIEDVILVKPKVFGDNRGFFMESYKKSSPLQFSGITEVISWKHIITRSLKTQVLIWSLFRIISQNLKKAF